MKTICSKEACTGCTACMNACPRSCITMEPDEKGFLYPVIDESKCLECDKCNQACPVISCDNTNQVSRYFAVINKDTEERKSSSSGGCFSIVARYVISKGGLVAGCSFDDKFQVLHILAEDPKMLKKISGSKYVQSNLGNIFTRIRLVLEQGKTVLFTGTACQVAGLKKFLRKDYPNLITQDIICHGVPSPLIWNKYLEYRTLLNHGKIKDVNFRFKEESWYNYKIRIDFDNNTSYENHYQEDIYLRLYLNEFSIRPSCYQCRFKSMPRMSDYTLGDFWGVEKCYPEMFDDKGTSLLIIHSKRGQKLFEALQDQFISKEVVEKEALQYNPFALKSVIRPKKSDLFFSEINHEDFFKKAARFVKRSLLQRILGKTSRLLKLAD